MERELGSEKPSLHCDECEGDGCPQCNGTGLSVAERARLYAEPAQQADDTDWHPLRERGS